MDIQEVIDDLEDGYFVSEIDPAGCDICYTYIADHTIYSEKSDHYFDVCQYCLEEIKRGLNEA